MTTDWPDDWELLGYCLIDGHHFKPISAFADKRSPSISSNSEWRRYNKDQKMSIVLEDRDETRRSVIARLKKKADAILKQVALLEGAGK